MHDFKFNLGDEVKDNITGFVGIVYNRTQWLNNCNTYCVKPKLLNKDGQPAESAHFDEPQLTALQKKTMPAHRETGGPERPVPQTNR